jgi:hypothetical protein
MEQYKLSLMGLEIQQGANWKQTSKHFVQNHNATGDDFISLEYQHTKYNGGFPDHGAYLGSKGCSLMEYNWEEVAKKTFSPWKEPNLFKCRRLQTREPHHTKARKTS